MDKEARKYIKETAEELAVMEMEALEKFTKNRLEPDEYANNMKKVSQILLRGELICLSDALYKTSINAGKDSDIDKLKKQTQLLDQIMLRMLSNADINGNTDLKQYSMALRAQNQSRSTLMATEVLKQREEKRLEKQKGELLEKQIIAAKERTNFTKTRKSSRTNFTNQPIKED